MWSIHDFCSITEKERTDDLHAVFGVSLNKDCDVYRGHFPGKPVCPGVCNIATIKACAAMLLGKDVAITSLKQCRLTAVATPDACPELSVVIEAKPAADGYDVTATMSDADQTYMTLRGCVGEIS